jgi:ComF family protein
MACNDGSAELDGGVCRVCWGRLLPAPAVETPKPIDRMAVAFAYNDTLRALIHEFKFNQTPGLARPLAEHFRDRLDGMGFVFFESVIVPVPAHPARLRERGYNPAELLAKELAELLELPFQPKIVKRVKHSPHQSSLPDSARKTGLKDVFRVNEAAEDQAENTRLVLVDDVVHSGRTIGQLARAARKAGWKKIDAVCLCA